MIDQAWAHEFAKEWIAAWNSHDLVRILSHYVVIISAAVSPDEIEPDKEYVEGARTQITVNGFERDLQARKACLKKHGFRCAVCAFDFEKCYGQVGKEFIHVHHLKPLSLADGEYELDPLADLRPVSPNCHAMLHRGKTLLSIEELRAMGWITDRICCLSIAAEIVRIIVDRKPAFQPIRQILESHQAASSY